MINGGSRFGAWTFGRGGRGGGTKSVEICLLSYMRIELEFCCCARWRRPTCSKIAIIRINDACQLRLNRQRDHERRRLRTGCRCLDSGSCLGPSGYGCRYHTIIASHISSAFFEAKVEVPWHIRGYNFRHRRQRTDLTASQRINHNDGFIGHWRRYWGTWISRHRSGTTRRTPRRQGIMYNMYRWLFWDRQRPKQETKRTCRWNRGGSCSWDSSNNLYENEHGCNDGCHSVAHR